MFPLWSTALATRSAPAAAAERRTATDAALSVRLDALRPGDGLTLVGCDAAGFDDVAPPGRPARRVLRLDLSDSATAEAAVGRILDDLAELAAALWPDWRDGEPAPGRPALATASWRRAALRRMRLGARPRLRGLPAPIQFAQLLLVLPELALLADVDPLRAERAAPVIATLEWCRRHGAATVATLVEPPAADPPWDHILHGALSVSRRPAGTALQRLSGPPGAARGSAVERRMREALRADVELRGLFEDEVVVGLGPLTAAPRVDLLWRAGRVVVELDGAEHERDPNYGADRHRDYELLVAGYLVLRLTNAEVALDLARSIDKIRRVVDLRRQPA